MNNSERKKKEGWWSRWHVWILGVVFAVFILLMWYYSWCWIEKKFVIVSHSENKPLLGHAKDIWAVRGTFGDMFGAVNALFSGLAFVGVIIAILLQRQELELQREELQETRKEFQKQNSTMTRQLFENTFFNMLRLYNEIVNSLEVKHTPKSKLSSSRESKYVAINLGDSEGAFAIYLNKLYDIMDSTKGLQGVQHIRECYCIFMGKYNHEVGHYFRTIYNILKFIHKNQELSNIDKRVYTNILRAQLSTNELRLLYYNCLSNDDFEPFKELVERFSILKHVENDNYLKREDNLYQACAFDKNIKYDENYYTKDRTEDTVTEG